MRGIIRYLIILLTLVYGRTVLDAQQLDSVKTAALEERLTEYFELLKYESIDVGGIFGAIGSKCIAFYF